MHDNSMTVQPVYPKHVIKARFGQPICVLGDHPGTRVGPGQFGAQLPGSRVFPRSSIAVPVSLNVIVTTVGESPTIAARLGVAEVQGKEAEWATFDCEKLAARSQTC